MDNVINYWTVDSLCHFYLEEASDMLDKWKKHCKIVSSDSWQMTCMDNHELCRTESLQDFTPTDDSITDEHTFKQTRGSRQWKPPLMWLVGVKTCRHLALWHMLTHTCPKQSIIWLKRTGKGIKAFWHTAYKCNPSWKCNYLGRHKNRAESDNTWSTGEPVRATQTDVWSVQQQHVCWNE